ncbi:RelA/SpoT domain-containing protein [Parasphingorhabdus pacifica]
MGERPAPGSVGSKPLPSKNQLKTTGDRIRKRSSGSLAESGGNERANEDVQLVNQWRSAHSVPLTRTRIGLGSIVMRVLDQGSQSGLVTQRLKRFESIVAKLIRDKSRLGEVEDIAGCRAVLPGRESVTSVWASLANAHKMKIERVKDYNENPHAGGYRALHLWCRRDGFKIEIQLRTAYQQNWAELIEEWDTTLGFDLKHEDAPVPVLTYFRELAAYYSLLDDNLADSAIDASALRQATDHVRDWLTREVQP